MEAYFSGGGSIWLALNGNGDRKNIWHSFLSEPFFFLFFVGHHTKHPVDLTVGRHLYIFRMSIIPGAQKQHDFRKYDRVPKVMTSFLSPPEGSFQGLLWYMILSILVFSVFLHALT